MKPNRISEARRRAGLTLDQLAERIQTSRGQIYQLEHGKRRLTQDWMERLGEALGCDPADLMPGARAQIPVVGIAGAGAAIHFHDDHAKGAALDYIDAPPGLPSASSAVALLVQGDSMLPVLEDGWMVVYSRSHEGITEECLNRLCVVRLEDDRTLVKKLKKGKKPGLYELISYNADPMPEQHVSWASRILSIVPK